MSLATVVLISVSVLATIHMPVPTVAEIQTNNSKGEVTSFDSCNDFNGPVFTEPSDCPLGGQEFRLCILGQHKKNRCIQDGNSEDYCAFCMNGKTFIDVNNNCTECVPCTICNTESEQVESKCTIYQDTVCEPKAPTTAPSLSCPPCPPIYQPTQPTSSGETTPRSTQTSSQETSTASSTEGSVTTPLLNECNCTNCTTLIGPSRLQNNCSTEHIIFGILFGICIIIIIILIVIIVRQTRRYKDLKHENRGLKNEVQSIKPGIRACNTTVAHVCEGDTTDGNVAEPNGPNTYVDEPVPGDGGSDGARDDEGNPGGKPKAVGRVSADPLRAGPSSRQSNLDYESIHPISSHNHNNSTIIQPLSSEEEEEESAAGGGDDAIEEEPPYARSDFRRKAQSVKGRLERNPDEPMPLSSLDTPPALPKRNTGLQRSHTFNPSPAAQVRADVHFTPDGYSTSTLPSRDKIGHLNPDSDKCVVNISDEEPSVTDPLVPRTASPLPDSVRNNEAAADLDTSITPLVNEPKKKKGILSKFRKSKSDKGHKSDNSPKPSSPANVSQNVPGVEINHDIGASASTSNPKNIEDLYAKVDKSKKKKPPGVNSSVSGDGQSQNGLHLDTKTPQDSTESRITPPSDGIGVTSLPPLKTDKTDTLSVPRQLSVGVSPTDDIPNEIDPLTVNNNMHNSISDGKLRSGVELSKPTHDASDRLLSPADDEIHSIGGRLDVSVIMPDNKGGATEMSSINSGHSNGAGGLDPHRPSKDLLSGSGDARSKNNGAPTKKIPKDQVAKDLDFDLIAREMSPKDLPSLYRHLEISKPRREQAEYDCTSTYSSEKAIAVLQAWKKWKGKEATRKAIIKALREGGNGERADYFEEQFDQKGKEEFTEMQESIV